MLHFSVEEATLERDEVSEELMRMSRCVNNSPNRKINDSWGIKMFPN